MSISPTQLIWGVTDLRAYPWLFYMLITRVAEGVYRGNRTLSKQFMRISPAQLLLIANKWSYCEDGKHKGIILSTPKQV